MKGKHTKTTSPEEREAFIRAGKTVLDVPLEEEVSKSYLEYAYSVIHSRALNSFYLSRNDDNGISVVW